MNSWIPQSQICIIIYQYRICIYQYAVPSAPTWRHCRLLSLCWTSFFFRSEETTAAASRPLCCLRPPEPPASPAAGVEAEPELEGVGPEPLPAPARAAASLSADCTRLSSGERGDSALLGRDATWRTSGGGDECSLAAREGRGGAAGWPRANSGEGERCGELPCGVGDGVRASGDSGMLPADLRRGERYCRCSLGARPVRELGLAWAAPPEPPEPPAGELGTLEPGELL